ncbi:MAG: type II CAAX endopeptidase family protein [Pseudomonadota bacterium]
MKSLREVIRQLPPGVEFLVVIMWAFGMPIFTSILSLGQPQGAVVFNDAALIGTVVFELMVAAGIIWFLRLRDWSLEKVGLRVDLRGTAWGIALLGVFYALSAAVQLAAHVLPIDMNALVAQMPRTDGELSMELVFIVSVVNGIFEEVFVVGYAITALQQARGMWTAINVSTAVRVMYHLYQGPFAFLAIAPMGLLFGYIYARTRQLWPLIVAHVLLDVVGLLFGLQK